MSTAPKSALADNDDMSWIADRHRDEKLLTEGAPVLWAQFQLAIEVNVRDYKHLYRNANISIEEVETPDGAVSLNVHNRANRMVKPQNVYASFNDRDLRIEVQGPKSANFSFGVIEGELSMLHSKAPITPKAASRYVLEPVLFPKNRSPQTWTKN